jgi:hypothetical protein
MRMIRMHRRDCVSYLLVNDCVVVEWWVEYKVAYDVQWHEDAYVAFMKEANRQMHVDSGTKCT